MRNRSHRQEVKTITEYITANTTMPPFFPYPRFLLKMDLSQTAKLLYALLLDRSTLSQKNGWQDNEGRTYIVYPIAEIAEILDKSTMTIHDPKRTGYCRAFGEGTPGIFRAEPPLCESAGSSKGFFRYDTKKS